MPGPLTEEEKLALGQSVGYSYQPQNTAAPQLAYAPMPEMAAPYDYAAPEPVQSVPAVAPAPMPEPQGPLASLAPVADPFQGVPATTPPQEPTPVVAPQPVAVEPQPAQQPARQAQPTPSRNPMDRIAKREQARADESKAGAENARTDYDASIDAQVAALNKQSDAQEKMALAQIDAARVEQGVLDEQANLAKDRQANYDTVLRDMETKRANLDREIASGAPKDRRTDMQKMGSLIAIALSGIGDAVAARGGANQDNLGRTLSIIDMGIERDLNEQREALNNKKSARASLDNDYVRARQAFGDAALADKVYIDTRLAKNEAALKEWLARPLSEQAKAATQLAIGGIQEKRAALQLDINTRMQAEAQGMADRMTVASYQERRQAAAAQARSRANDPMVAELAAKERKGNITAKEMAMLNSLRAGAADAEKKRVEAGGGGDTGFAIQGLERIPGKEVTKESFGKAQDAKIKMEKVTRHLDAMRDLATEDTSIYPYDNDRMKVESKFEGQRASALALISQLVDAGVLNEGDAERYMKAFPEPDAAMRNDMSAEAKQDVYDSLKETFRANSTDGLSRLGYRPPTVTFTEDKGK